MPGQVPVLPDERELLLAYVAQQRDGLRYAAFGLTDDQARLTPTASAVSIGGLITHVTAMERSWTDLILQRESSTGGEAAYADGFSWRPRRSLAEALAEFDAVAPRRNRSSGGRSLDHPVPVPKGVPWFPADVEAWSVRWVLLHLMEETAATPGTPTSCASRSTGRRCTT